MLTFSSSLAIRIFASLTLLTIVIASHHVGAQTSNVPIDKAPSANTEPAKQVVTEEISVVGEQPGPGMWKVTKGDNTMWIIGTHTPLPRNMKWKAKGLKEVIASAQEILSPPGVSIDGDQIGFFTAISLIPTAMDSHKNPDGAMLKDLVPYDVYQRWIGLRDKYIDENNTNDESQDIERWRPIMAALKLYDEAIKKNGMTQQSPVWKTIEAEAKARKVKIIETSAKPKIKNVRGAVKEFSKARLDDVECFTKTIERIENDLRNMRARGNAWATGDVELLKRIPGADQRAACADAIRNATMLKILGVENIDKQVDDAWLAAVDQAMAKNACLDGRLRPRRRLANGCASGVASLLMAAHHRSP
jgi:hypothetical protein